MSRLAPCLVISLLLGCGASPPSGSATPRTESGAGEVVGERACPCASESGAGCEASGTDTSTATRTCTNTRAEAVAEAEAEAEAEADADAEAVAEAEAVADVVAGSGETSEGTRTSTRAEPAPASSADATALDPGAALSPAVIAHAREIASRRTRREDVFIKVGDSATVNRAFMQCFSDDDEIALDGRDALRPLIDRVRATRVRGTDSFRRESRAAGVGWSVYRVLSGPSSALAEEVRAMSPRYALVMFGGNDVETGSLRRYESRMNELVDRLTRWGVVPILSTIPPRNDDPEADQQVPRFNAALRALAEERRLPLVDLHAAMLAQPDRGLASDGVHPSAPVRGGRAHGCDLTAEGLEHGQNVRNLLNLQMIAALRAALAD